MSDVLQEAHAPSDFLSRVSALHQGEVARLEGGVAVKRLATEDGRDGFRVAAPSTYRTDPDFYGELYRTAEDACREAFRRSASSTDPESIGGASRISTYGPYMDGGREVRIRDWTTDGRAIIAPAGQPGAEKVVDPASLVRRSPVLYESELQEVEQARPGTNFTKIPPQNVKKLEPIIKHYKGMAHPFSTCVRDQIKHGLSEDHANRRCAVVKDLGEGTTKWRKGSKKLSEETLTEETLGLYTAAILEANPDLAEALLQEVEGPLAEEWSDAARRAAYLARIGRLRAGGAGVLLDHGVKVTPKADGTVHVSSPHSLTEHHPATSPEKIVDAVFRHQQKATRRQPEAWKKLVASEEPFWLPPLQEALGRPTKDDRDGDGIPFEKSKHRAGIKVTFPHPDTGARVAGTTTRETDPTANAIPVERGGKVHHVKPHLVKARTPAPVVHNAPAPPGTKTLPGSQTVHASNQPAEAAQKGHYAALGSISHIGGKIPEGFKVKKAEAPETYDMKRVESVHAVHGPDGTHLGYVGKVDYAGERVMSGRIQVGTTGKGKRWAAFTEKGKRIQGSVHYSKNRFDALRSLGRYHPDHGKG